MLRYIEISQWSYFGVPIAYGDMNILICMYMCIRNKYIISIRDQLTN